MEEEAVERLRSERVLPVWSNGVHRSGWRGEI